MTFNGYSGFPHGSKVLHKHFISSHNLSMSVKPFLFSLWGYAQDSVQTSGKTGMGVPGSWFCLPINALLLLKLSMNNSLFRVVSH